MNSDPLFQAIELPCGVVLKNRLVKSAMSDSLGDGCGNPTDAQARLYERWAQGGIAASIIGEVQCTPDYAEKPGNLVLRADSDDAGFKELALKGSTNDTQLWLQLGHAGAMAHEPISEPKGPSAIDIPGLRCTALELDEIRRLPAEFADTARRAESLGFGGVQIHAAHGFLLSQFLSPLFNRRDDDYGGSIQERMRLLMEVVDEVRAAVSPSFAVAIKLNSTDQLENGLIESDALEVVSALDATGVDLIDISGGTYFPGAQSASDSAGGGPYFLDFMEQARQRTSKPLMLTGGFKTRTQADSAVTSGNVDVVGLARTLVLDAQLPNKWLANTMADPVFPRFTSPPEGGITAWYTLRLTQLAEDRETTAVPDLASAITEYEQRDNERVLKWKQQFSQ